MHICAPFYSAAVRSGLRRETWGRSLRAIMATSAVPATLKPSATLVCLQPWVTAEPTDLEDDMAAAMRAAVKKARGAAAPKTPPKAMPKTPPKAAPKSAPAGKPQSKLAAMPKKGGGCKRAGEQLDLHLERLGVGSGTAQAPRSRSAAFPMVLRAGGG